MPVAVIPAACARQDARLCGLCGVLGAYGVGGDMLVDTPVGQGDGRGCAALAEVVSSPGCDVADGADSADSHQARPRFPVSIAAAIVW